MSVVIRSGVTVWPCGAFEAVFGPAVGSLSIGRSDLGSSDCKTNDSQVLVFTPVRSLEQVGYGHLSDSPLMARQEGITVFDSHILGPTEQ